MMGLSSCEIKNAAMSELPLFAVIAPATKHKLIFAGGLRKRASAYYFSMDTSVALIIAKTLSPSLRFIRLTEPVVIIDVMSPAAVLMVSSETTLSETILSIVPGSRFRMLVLIVRDSSTERRAP